LMGKKFRLPTEIPLEEYPSSEEFIAEALDCVEEAEKEGIILRIMGGMAIYLHSQEYENLWRMLGRLGERVFTDIDFASYGRYGDKLLKFFEKRGYSYDPRLLWHYGRQRQIFFGGRVPMVEVFFDRLEMCHTINFKGRLEVDKPTLPPTELMLQKLQIVELNEKDIKDLIVLLRAHPVGMDDEDKINLNVLKRAGLMDDWGFWYTVTTNLRKVRESLRGYDVLSDEDVGVVDERIKRLLEFLEKEPKSLKWKMRARVGTKKKWYREVEDWF